MGSTVNGLNAVLDEFRPISTLDEIYTSDEINVPKGDALATDAGILKHQNPSGQCGNAWFTNNPKVHNEQRGVEAVTAGITLAEMMALGNGHEATNALASGKTSQRAMDLVRLERRKLSLG